MCTKVDVQHGCVGSLHYDPAVLLDGSVDVVHRVANHRPNLLSKGLRKCRGLGQHRAERERERGNGVIEGTDLVFLELCIDVKVEGRKP